MKILYSKLCQFYGDLKLQSKFTLALTLAVSVPALLFGFLFYGNLYDMIVANTLRKEQDISSKTAPLIEDTFQEIIDTYSLLTQLPFYETLFHKPISPSMDSLAASSAAFEFKNETASLLKNSPITGVRIYLDLPEKSSSFFESDNTKGIFSPIQQIRGTYWHGIFQGSPINELFCPSFYLGALEKKENSDMAYIRSTTFYLNGHAYPAYISLYFSSSSLKDILDEQLTLDGGVSYIVNERDSLVASTNESLSGMYWLDYQNIETSFMSSNNFIERTILDKKIYASFYRLSIPGWFMVTVHPSVSLLQQSKNIILRYVLLYSLLLISAILFSNLLARSITKRISSVILQMKKVREGLPIPMNAPQFHDEVGDLIDTYNYMTHKMEKLILEQQKAAEDLRIAEFNALQAQINPHFLYNTMDMINWQAQQGYNKEVCNTVQSLSRFYKLTLSKKQNLSTIESEEEHISIYVQLQNMRFHNNITFVSDLPDELLSYEIPKLTLQPVVENAILHGILEKNSKKGTIVFTGWMEDNDIVLLISDDGIGISAEKLKTILSDNPKASSKGTNIAIYNTHKRLQLLYGNSYGLSYSSELNVGTDVQIRIPAHRS